MVAPTNSGSLSHHVQQQTTTACVSRPTGLGCGCPQSALVPFQPLYIPTSSHLGQSGGELLDSPSNRIILIPSDWPNKPWF